MELVYSPLLRQQTLFMGQVWPRASFIIGGFKTPLLRVQCHTYVDFTPGAYIGSDYYSGGINLGNHYNFD